MTKISKKSRTLSIETQINKSYDIINNFLPKRYVLQVQLKLDNNTSSQLIRNVRCRYKNYHLSNINVLKALVEVALENKKQQEELKQLIN